MEKEYSHKILIAGLGGSYSLGLENATSDLDLFVVFEGDDIFCSCNTSRELFSKTNKLDLMCLPIGQIIEEAAIWKKEKTKFPTVYNESVLKRAEQKSKKDTERNDFTRALLFRALLSNKVWKMNNLIQYRNYDNSLDKAIRVIDICDFLFTRAYGNYYEYVNNKKSVLLRKYLYTMHEICSLKWLIEYGTKPEPDFYKLIDNLSLEYEIISIFKQWYFLNRENDLEKSKALVPCNLLINIYFDKELKKLGNLIANVDKEKVLQL